MQQDAGPPEHGPRETPAVPPTKKRRLVGKQAPCGQALEATVVRASLEGVEQRLACLGEVPRFKLSENGGLEHRCTFANAIVRFWPGTPAWCVESLDCEAVEARLSAPVATSEEGGPSGDSPPAV